MSLLVADCPRCGAKRISFDAQKALLIGKKYNWENFYEVFCICRNCSRSTTFVLSQKSSKVDLSENTLVESWNALNDIYNIEDFISLKNHMSSPPPAHLPSNIFSIFEEAATCFAMNCFNASGAMFRLCVDLATKGQLPEGNQDGLTRTIKNNLAARLKWLFETKRLSSELQELAQCIKDDGNDGVHDGSLTNEDVEDLIDFTYELLERIYTDPERLRLAKERRAERRSQR